MTEDYRPEFFETIQSLAELQDGVSRYDQIVWKIEYLSRSGHWFNYYGIIRGSRSCSIGHDYDVSSGLPRNVDAETSICTALDFDANNGIAAYRGFRKNATDILDEVQAFDPDIPEVLRLSAECRETMPRGRRVTVVTDMAFVGFKRHLPVGEPRLFANDKNLPSLVWCRGRRFISALDFETSAV